MVQRAEHCTITLNLRVEAAQRREVRAARPNAKPSGAPSWLEVCRAGREILLFYTEHAFRVQSHTWHAIDSSRATMAPFWLRRAMSSAVLPLTTTTAGSAPPSSSASTQATCPARDARPSAVHPPRPAPFTHLRRAFFA
eukprot:scaffold72240_cov69-Phaeocystis_antarctica.AAC.3